MLIRRVMVHLPLLSVLLSVAAAFCLSPTPSSIDAHHGDSSSSSSSSSGGEGGKGGRRRGRSQSNLYRYSSFVEPLDQNWAVEKEGGDWSDWVI